MPKEKDKKKKQKKDKKHKKEKKEKKIKKNHRKKSSSSSSSPSKSRSVSKEKNKQSNQPPPPQTQAQIVYQTELAEKAPQQPPKAPVAAPNNQTAVKTTHSPDQATILGQKASISQTKEPTEPQPIVERSQAEPAAQAVDEDQDEKKIEEEMMKLFGFTQFGSSKGKNHTDSSAEGFFKANREKRIYRQYMHRKGGFNRLLDEMK